MLPPEMAPCSLATQASPRLRNENWPLPPGAHSGWSKVPSWSLTADAGPESG